MHAQLRRTGDFGTEEPQPDAFFRIGVLRLGKLPANARRDTASGKRWVPWIWALGPLFQRQVHDLAGKGGGSGMREKVAD